jgi:heme-degrading monooxygenase HmoA
VTASVGERAVCVVTRLEFPKWPHLIRAGCQFPRLRSAAGHIDGFVDARIAIRRNRSMLLVSLWRNNDAMMAYRQLDAHLGALRRAIDTGAGVWSRPFDLRGTSSLSVSWLEPTEQWVFSAFGGARADGSRGVDAAVCVITRIRFRSFVTAARAWWKFRRLRRAANGMSGLAEALVRVDGRTGLLFVSIWDSEQSMLSFTSLAEHVDAVRWTIAKEGVVWSGVFDLRGPRHVPLRDWPNTVWRSDRGPMPAANVVGS